MTSNNEDEETGILYIHNVTIETPVKSGYRVKLNVDDSDIQLTRNGQTSTWVLPRSLEIAESSKIKVIVKTGHTVAGVSLGKEETVIKINVQNAVQRFLISMQPEVSESGNGIFRQHTLSVVVWFRSPPTTESVRSTLEGLQGAMGSFRHIMGDSTQKHLDTVIKYGVAFSELDPRSKVAFGVLTVTFELLKQQKQRDQAVTGLTRQLKRILPFANEALKETGEDNTDVLRTAIGRLYILTMDVAEFSCDYVKRNRFKRLAKSMISGDDQDKLSELTSGFNELEQDFNRAVNVEILKAVRDIEERMLLDRLQPIRVGHMLDRGCMEGTRVILLDDLIKWALRPLDITSPRITNTETVYWLYGTPGIGKTAIAHSICARLHKEGRLGGAFFCRRDDPDLSDPKCVLPTLVFKLAETWRAYRKLVADMLRKDPKLTRHSADGQLLSRLLESLQSHPPHSIVLVVDGLDECGDRRSRSSIISSLMDASSRVNWLRIIVTSRQDSDIETCFKRFNGRYSAKDLATDDKGRDDIYLFAQYKLSNVAVDYGLPSDWPGSEKLDEIVERSGGLFVFVETLSRSLDGGLDPDQYLDQALSAGTGSALESLYTLYTTSILSKIGQNKREFRCAMGTIIVVGRYRPLSDAAVAQLAGLRIHIVTALVNRLGSLLYRDAGAKEGIRVRHLSVIDFLTGSSASEDLRVDTEQANRDVGFTCLRVMTQGLRFNICQIDSSFMSNQDITDLQSRVDQSISDALQYSCLHWSDHLSHISNTQDDAVITALVEFTKAPRLLYWMEALSVMGKVSVGDSVLRRVPSWINSSESSVEQRISDALKFLLAFQEPITTSAPHIYISGLAFIPTDTDLWRNASGLFRNLLITEKGRNESWPGRLSTLMGHTGAVISVACSPDGRRVISGSEDKTIRIWDAETGAAVGEPLEGHTECINSVAFAPDGRRFISGSEDKTIRIWDVDTGEAVDEPLVGHTDSISSVAYSPDGRRIISGSLDGLIRIWDAETGDAVGEPLAGHTSCIYSIAYSPNGRRIVSGSRDKSIHIWDADTGAAVGMPLRGHTDWIRSVAYSPNGDQIISGSDDTTIRVWDAETGAAVGEPLEGHSDHILSVGYSSDGRSIISSSEDQTIRIWDTETGAPLGESLRGDTDRIYSVLYSPDGRSIIAGFDDKTIRIWDAETRATVGEPSEGHTDQILSISYSPDGRHIISSSKDKTIRIWDAETGTAVGKPLEGHSDHIWSVGYSPDGQRIVSGSGDKLIRIWDAKTGAGIGDPLEGHTEWINSVTYSPDGRHIASGSDDETIRIWDANAGAPVGEPLLGHTAGILSVAYSPDGRRIISGSQDMTVRVWDAETGAPLGEPLQGHTDWVLAVAYSPDGRHLVSSSRDKTIRIWDADTGEPVGKPLTEHNDWIRDVTYSPDGSYILSGSDDKTIRIWDARTQTAVGKPLNGHTDWIRSVLYSLDGRRIVSSSNDMSIRIWDPATANDIEVTDPTTNLHPDSSGWVRHADGGLLFWVPEDCRNGLTCPASLTIPTTGRHRVVRLDLSQFSYGPSWTDIKIAGI